MAPQRNAGAGAEAELPEYAGHYRLESCLGSGGMGVVHMARSASGMKLAVKVVHAQFAKDPDFRGRFRQEVAAARKVSGAFTAPVVDADPESERPWMATLFIPGPTLSDQVKRNGPMEPAQLRRLMAGLAEALRDIHRAGVVHRDLKPSNVLLADDGPKVIDFGISRPMDSELRTETGRLIGTPPFMAPEQFRRPREVGPSADIFALGSVMVHAATGRGPFDSDSPYIVAYQVVHDEPDLTGVPDEVAPLVLRCLAKEPEDRPTPDELMRELRSVAASYDTQTFIPAQRTGDTEGSWPPAGKPDRGVEAARAVGAGHAVVAGDAVKAGRGRRLRLGRRTLLGAGAFGLAVVGALASLALLDGDVGSPQPASPRTTSAAFSGWRTTPAAGDSAPLCSHGAGRLLCATSGLVFALDPSDGHLLWRHPVGKGPRTESPVLAGGLVQPSPDRGRRLEALDPASGTVTPVLARHYTEHLRGVNDLFFAANGDMYFTDQGRTGHQDPTGRVYRVTAAGRLECLLSRGINPNGVVTNLDESVLYVGMTNANAVWHIALMPDGGVTAVGTILQLSGGIGPDGLALTADGGLVVAHPGMGAVWVFSRRGEPLYRINSCGSDLVTNIAFGGPDMKSLYMTDSGNGQILVAKVPVAGRPMHSHADAGAVVTAAPTAQAR